jgi:hypothetical protein
MGRLKFLNIRAVVDQDQMAMGCRKNHDGPNWPPREITGQVVEGTIRVVNIPRDGGELDNERTGRRRCSSSGCEGIVVLVDLDRVHDYAVLVTAIQMMIARKETE